MHETHLPSNKTDVAHVAPQHQHKPLRQYMRDAMCRYLSQLNGERPTNIYELVLGEIEPPLLETVMIHCKGNQSRAAKMLGLSRGTLRAYLKKYFENRKPGKQKLSG